MKKSQSTAAVKTAGHASPEPRGARTRGSATKSSSSGAAGPTASSASAPRDGITGFGATTAAWKASHTLDQRYSAGTVYNPDPSIPAGAEYDLVMFQDGRVLGYDLQFANLPVAAARAKVAGELPHDTRRVAFVVKSTCAFELLRSATLARALGSKAIGDSSGAVLVEFVSGAAEDHYDSSAVNDALFGLGPTSPSNIPAC